MRRLAAALPLRLLVAGVAAEVSAVVVCLLTLGIATYQKAPCASRARVECYSDIVNLWSLRDLPSHAVPYVHGGVVMSSGLPTFTGHEIEYPVLSGLWIWLASLPTQSLHTFFFVNVLMLAPLAAWSAFLLARMVGRRALLFAAAPSLVWYAFLNWDLTAVAVTVTAIYLWRKERYWLAGALLGVGGCFKLWPALLLAPLAADLWLRRDRRAAAGALGSAAAVAVVANLPFMINNFGAWKAPFTFQTLRPDDRSANSLWPFFLPTQVTTATVNHVSDIGLLVVFGIILYAGWRRYLRDGEYPFIQVSAALVIGFITFGKVHSPQYSLWVLPFFCLVRLRFRWWVAFMVADAWMFVQWAYMPVYDYPRWFWPSSVALIDIILLLLIRAVLTAPAAVRRVDSGDHPEAVTAPAEPAVTVGVLAGAGT